MSNLSTGVLGLFAASLAFGGVQFVMASDEGLSHSGGTRQDLIQRDVRRDVASHVNRATKTDREALVTAPLATTTLAFQLRGLNDTSIAMRLPVADALRLQPPVTRSAVKATGAPNSGTPKPMVACELSVSPLTDIAKQLGPGRCIT